MFDLICVARWYACVSILAVIAYPLVQRLFVSRSDYGWAFARCVSGPLIVYLAWLLSSAGAVRWGAPALYIAAATVLALALVTSGRFFRDIRTLPLREIARVEAVFVAIFLLVLLIRGMKPDVFGLEKFTNWAFINAILASATMPPPDPWFAGATLNYYYLGHALSAGLIALSGTPSDIGYNIMFAHISGCVGAAAFSLTRSLAGEFDRLSARASTLTGWLASLVLVFGGNLHFLVYGWIRPRLSLFGLLPPPLLPYRYTNSARYIGYDPPTLDKTITDFPAYSTYIGDLHAHVINLPVTLALTMLCAELLRRHTTLAPSPLPRLAVLRQMLPLRYLFAASLLLAWSSMANTWDFPFYAGLFALTICTTALLGKQTIRTSVALGTIAAIATSLLALALAWPFWHQFQSFSRGIALPRHASPPWQLFVLYGGYYLCCLSATIPALACFREFTPGMHRSLAFTAILFLFALALIAFPEIIAVKDIYGDEFQRANTMFKATYHAVVVLTIAAAVAIAFLVSHLSGAARLGWLLGGVIVASLSLTYGWFCYDQYLRPVGAIDLSLRGDRFLDREGTDGEAVRFLRDNMPAPGETVLEAAGESFTYGSRISTATGIPTVIGWKGHEWLWRGLGGGVATRGDEISRFYTTDDVAFQRDFLRRYRVRYIVVGSQEQKSYPALRLDRLRELGNMVLDSATQIIRIEPSHTR